MEHRLDAVVAEVDAFEPDVAAQWSDTDQAPAVLLFRLKSQYLTGATVHVQAQQRRRPTSELSWSD